MLSAQLGSPLIASDDALCETVAHPPLHRGGDAGRHALETTSWLCPTIISIAPANAWDALCNSKAMQRRRHGCPRVLPARLGAMPIGQISKNGRNLPCSVREALGKLAPRDRSRTQSRIPQRVRGGLPASTVTRGAKCRSRSKAKFTDASPALYGTRPLAQRANADRSWRPSLPTTPSISLSPVSLFLVCNSSCAMCISLVGIVILTIYVCAHAYSAFRGYAILPGVADIRVMPVASCRSH